MNIMEHSESNALKRCREGHGYTQGMLGKLLGFRDGSWVSRWEHGKTMPNLESAIKLSILLNASINDLFNDLTEKAQTAVRKQALMVSLTGGVPGIPQDTEQPQSMPQGQGTDSTGRSEASGS